MTQKDMVLAYINERGSITSMEAFAELGITRLSDVVFRLKRDGYKFDTKIEKCINRYGHKTEFARYSLSDNEAENML